MKSLCVFPLALSLCLLALCSSVAKESKDKGRGDRDKSAIPDIYDALIRIIKRERLPPLKERPRAQRSAMVRYWTSDTKSFRSAESRC